MRLSLHLTPGDVLAKRAARKAARALTLLSCLLALAIGGAAIVVARDTARLNVRNAALSEKLAQWRKEADDLNRDPLWRSFRAQKATLIPALHATGPGFSGTLRSLETALPDGVSVREVQFSRKSGRIVVVGTSRLFGGAESLRERIAREADPRWRFLLEENRYEQATRKFGFRLTGSWSSR